MDAAENRHPARGADLLIEHCAALDAEHAQPTARERLERLVGGYLARLLVGALSARRSRPVESD
jgi:hypothetical protein